MMISAGLDENESDIVLGILSDRYCRKILNAIIDEPKSAFEISYESDILLSTVYRKLKTLQSHKLLNTKCQLRDDGKKLFLYKSKIRSISARLDRDVLDVAIVPNSPLTYIVRTQDDTAGI
jgi:predicted transcriptional regulator